MKQDATLDDLVDQVGNLTSATTDLLNATSTSKATLDQAVDEAKGHAQSADNANTSAVNAKEEAKTAASEAKEAEANATAIVHNDEGTTTPTPGAYPVADSKGHLDIGWTPLLAAMYPYSGVIGSVDKKDLFSSEGGQGANNGDAFWSNKIRIFPVTKTFNIAGRLVQVTRVDQTLPEAESTADRAIAFDDIFLDWNGNVQTYRSITPHRTTTGYDCDAIAGEHGYTKVQTGLYKTGDTYALLLGRVARRNQGAYHPVFNPEGTRMFNRKDASGVTTWDDIQAILPITSVKDCFSFSHQTSVPLLPTHISGGDIEYGYCGRKNVDNKPYDAIYADDFTPLYYSAKNVIDRQALLFDNFNRAIAGETFSGAEGTALAGIEMFITGDSDSSISISLDKAEWPDDTYMNMSYLYGAVAYIQSGDFKGRKLKIRSAWWHTSNLSPSIRFENSSADEGDGFFYPDPTNDNKSRLSRERLFIPALRKQVQKYQSYSARPQFLMVDIIGALDAMPDEWKTHGIPGNWLAVGEEGESLIPDGTEKNFKLSRKCLECYQLLESSDKGATWSDGTSWAKPMLEGNANGWTADRPANQLIMIFYRTSANPFELADTVAEMALIPTVSARADQRPTFGNLLVSHLIGKVPEGATNNGYEEVNMVRTRYDQRIISIDGYSYDVDRLICSYAKVRAVIGASLNYQNMYLKYKETKHNGTNFGDNGNLPVVSKQSTVTDLNGETVIVGQKRVELPYHFDGLTY